MEKTILVKSSLNLHKDEFYMHIYGSILVLAHYKAL